MNIPNVEGMNMMKEYDHPSNHQMRKESMNMMEEHNQSSNHRLGGGYEYDECPYGGVGRYRYDGGAFIEPLTGGGGY
jgi:hypothetical protein